MSRIKNYKQHLVPLFEAFFITNDAQKIKEHLISNSNLPSPRANLELAKAFANMVEQYSEHESEKLWKLCSEIIKISAEEAPTNDPKEFLPFCGASGIGDIGSVSLYYFEQSLSMLKMLTNDSRWRIREAVCFGVQRLIRKRGMDTLNHLERWIIDGTLLELRAVAVAVAEPVLLKNEQIAYYALNLHKQIFNRIQNTADRKSEHFRILRKALGFTFSTVVCEVPEPAFKFMHDLINSRDPDMRWILKENLKKNRLVKNYPEKVEFIKKMLP